MMIQQTPWIERKFQFNFPVGLFPVIIERLRGTIFRLKAMTSQVDNNKLSIKPGNKWSIKEHIGHLYDLEELWYGRIEDFLAGKNELRAADMTNAKTQQADHNSKSLEHLLSHFSTARERLIEKLKMADEKTAAITALHPRLQQPMRLVDSLFFVAEHDDHHLAVIRELVNR